MRLRTAQNWCKAWGASGLHGETHMHCYNACNSHNEHLAICASKFSRSIRNDEHRLICSAAWPQTIFMSSTGCSYELSLEAEVQIITVRSLTNCQKPPALVLHADYAGESSPLVLHEQCTCGCQHVQQNVALTAVFRDRNSVICSAFTSLPSLAFWHADACGHPHGVIMKRVSTSNPGIA